LNAAETSGDNADGNQGGGEENFADSIAASSSSETVEVQQSSHYTSQVRELD
jgi:hypothetical protein